MDKYLKAEIIIECVGAQCRIMNKKTLLLCIVYSPPSGNICMTEILSLAHDEEYQGIYVFEDFNTDSFRQNDNCIREFIHLMLSFFHF